MTEITRHRQQLPFSPDETKKKLSITKAAVQYATEMRDWEKLHIAIDEMIDIQKQFVAWWGDSVRGAGNPQLTQNAVNLISVKDAEKATSIGQQQVSRWRTRLDDAIAYHADLFQHEHRKAMARLKASELVQQSLTNEHYTPAKYLDAARIVLGTIDLDPASCEEANRVVKAAEYFDKDANGLDRIWQGRVWLNPPYGGLAGKFIAKLSDEFAAGNVAASIALVNSSSTDTAWFQTLWNGLLCFTNHRINFYGGDDRSGSTHGSVFVYFGSNGAAFIEHFCQFGPILRRCDDGRI